METKREPLEYVFYEYYKDKVYAIEDKELRKTLMSLGGKIATAMLDFELSEAEDTSDLSYIRGLKDAIEEFTSLFGEANPIGYYIEEKE